MSDPSKLRSQLLEIMNEDEINIEIDKIIKEYSELINKDAAMHILASEKGLISKGKKKVLVFKELTEGSGYTFEGKVARVFQTMEGKSHKSKRVLIKDIENNELILVLWDEQADVEIKQGDTIHIENAYFRNGEMHLGIYGKISIDKNLKYTRIMELKDGRVNVLIRIVQELQTRTYVKNNEEKIMAKGEIADDSGRIPIVIWGKRAVESFKNKSIGAKYHIENAYFRNGELHVNEYSRVIYNPEKEVLLRIDELIRGIEGPIEGVIETVTEDLEGIVVSGGKKVKAIFEPNCVNHLFKNKPSKDIDPKVSAYLKLKSMVKSAVILTGTIKNGNLYVKEVKL